MQCQARSLAPPLSPPLSPPLIYTFRNAAPGLYGQVGEGKELDMSTNLEERQRRNAKFLNFLESEDARDVRELLMEERDV